MRPMLGYALRANPTYYYSLINKVSPPLYGRSTTS